MLNWTSNDISVLSMLRGRICYFSYLTCQANSTGSLIHFVFRALRWEHVALWHVYTPLTWSHCDVTFRDGSGRVGRMSWFPYIFNAWSLEAKPGGKLNQVGVKKLSSSDTPSPLTGKKIIIYIRLRLHSTDFAKTALVGFWDLLLYLRYEYFWIPAWHQRLRLLRLQEGLPNQESEGSCYSRTAEPLP